MKKIRFFWIVGALAAIACGEDQPASPSAIEATAPPIPVANGPALTSVQRIECTGRVDTKAVQCGTPSALGALGDVIIGSQNEYVRLTSSNIAYDGTSFSFDVTVTNLIPQTLATSDGTSADPNGVRIFFHEGPTVTGGSGSISVANADGVGAFTGSNQPYFQYTSQLGADERLVTDEISAARNWVLSIPSTVTTFSFSVYVAAAVQYPNGYVDVTGTQPYLRANATLAPTSVARTVVGKPVSGATLSYASSAPAIATVDASTGAVNAVAPGFATINVTSSVATTASYTVQVCPNLAVGEVYNTSGSDAASTCLGGNGAAEEYTIIPYNSSQSSSTSLTITGTGIQAVTGPPSPVLIPNEGVRVSSESFALPAGEPGSFDVKRMVAGQSPPSSANAEVAQLLRRVAANVELADQPGGPFAPDDAEGQSAETPGSMVLPGDGGERRLGYYEEAEPVDGSDWVPVGADPSVKTLESPAPFAVPAVNDIVSYNVASGCSGARDDRVGRVRSVSPHAVIVSDTANPAGGFTTAQYDSIALEFDSIAYPVVTDNFGAATDTDDNGRIILFFTRAVNELALPAASAFQYAYFTNRDVFASTGCTRSNEGEIIYFTVPDISGAVNSNVRTVSSIRGATTLSATRELTRLTNAFRRTYVTGAAGFETQWLDDALSAVGAELAFYRTSVGLAPRQNIQLSSLTTGPNASRRVAAYNTFENINFGTLRPWLQRPDTVGVSSAPTVPSSTVSISSGAPAARGVAWAFLRYAADRYVAAHAGSTDATFLKALVDNSSQTGFANIQSVIGESVTDWVRDFQVAMYADDNAFSVASRYSTPSWNYRSVYGGLGGFPLGTRPLTNNTPLTLSYGKNGSAFARAGVPAAGYATIAITSGGANPPATTLLSIVRTK